MTISRRAFLASTPALVAAARTLAITDEATAAPRNLRKAVKFGMVHGDLTVEEKFRRLVDLGFHGVEMPGPADLDRDEVIAARDATGLRIHGVVNSVHWQHSLSHPDADVRRRRREGLETAIRDAHAYGASTVLLVPAIVNKEVSYADAYARSQAEIKRVLPLAREHGVTIALENVWNNFLLSPLEAARYVDELGHPDVGWYLDIGNIVNYGWPEQWVETLGHRIVKIDVKEFSRAKRNDEGLWKGFAVELLEGDCDWPAVMSALDRVGFGTSRAGWLTAEIGGGDTERLRDISERMGRIMVMGTGPKE